MIEVKVPSVGESISEVVLIKWAKDNGTYVERDEVIAELESEKATFEVNAEQAGILQHMAKVEDTLQIGDVMAKIDETAEKPAGGSGQQKTEAEIEQKKEENPPKQEVPSESSKNEDAQIPVQQAEKELKGEGGKGIIDIIVPSVGESISEVTLIKWLKQEGALVKRDEPIAELESEKATFELNAEESGKLSLLAAVDDVLQVGQLVAKIDTAMAADEPASAAAQSQPDTPATKPEATAQPEQHKDVKASPVASAIIADKKVNPSDIKASGAGGKIMKNDVLSALENPGRQTFNEAPLNSRNERREKMTNLRKTISRRLVESKNTTAMLTTFNEVDMTSIMDIRKQYKDKFKEAHGVGLGFMSFFAKACAIALADFPAVNAYIDGNEIVYHDYADISIAVSTPKGLTVPVMRNVESKSMADIEKNVIELANKARDSKLSMEELQGGTFTITNGGVFGSLLSTPIINLPQSAILGMHKIQDRPIAENGQVVIRPMMYIALSYDHRIVDGKESVSFLVRVKELLENPQLLLFRKDPVKTLLEI